MKIEVLIGREAERLIEGAEFRGKWKKLYDKCPWRSVFQGDGFVVTWYDTYKSRFIPLIITGANPDGELAGLFTLAIAAESGQIVVAGTGEAEYHAWLADPQDGNAFIIAALEKLREKYPNGTLTLLFVLPAAPVEWTAPGSPWGRHCHVSTLPRGLMEIGDGSSLKDTLRKKKQSKINRLRRLGDLRLDRIQGPEELGAIFDEIICYQTLRLRAIQNLPGVEHDPLKKTFYMNLMRLPRMIHASALRLDDKLVSAQIHNYNGEQVRLGVITHSPFYARYSPGELHILMTGVELAKEEIPLFDLTPGGSYKDRYATQRDEVYVINIFFNRAHRIQYKIKRRLAETAKSAIRIFSITPEHARDAFSTFLDLWQKWLRLRMSDLLSESLGKLKRSLWYKDELRVYAFNLEQTHRQSGSKVMKRDQVSDLLVYQPAEAWQPPVNKFMRQALENLEAGHRVYTRVEDGKLAQYCWLIGSHRQKSPPPGSMDEKGPVLPPDSVLITDFYTYSQGRSLPPSSLHQVLLDAASTPGAKHAYIVIPAGDDVMRQVIEVAGFTYRFSFFRENVLGRVTCWSTDPQPSETSLDKQHDSSRFKHYSHQ
jgi:CelD/BcsL family acetyltransferase involved in cellulose biosynthesis